jgi:hypothetical protein
MNCDYFRRIKNTDSQDDAKRIEIVFDKIIKHLHERKDSKSTCVFQLLILLKKLSEIAKYSRL